MRRDSLLCLRAWPFVPPTTDWHGWPVVPNLARGMQLSGLASWVADIFVACSSSSPILAVILDAFGRRVLAWAMADHLKASLASMP